MPVEVDILEDSIFQFSPELLNTLLKDHTTSRDEMQRNIFWATSDYEHLGKEYQYNSPILPHLITGDNGHIIMPRVLKSLIPNQPVPVIWLRSSLHHGYAMHRTT